MRAVYLARFAAVAMAASACASGGSPTERAATSAAPNGVSRASAPGPVVVAPAPTPAAWTVAWTAKPPSCGDEWTGPSLSADRKSLVDGCTRISLASGAVTRARSRSFSVAPVSGHADSLSATSRDGTRTAAVEALDEGGETLSIRIGPDHRRACKRRFPNPIHPHAVASLADGRLALFAKLRCKKTRTDEDGSAPGQDCAERGLYAVADDCEVRPVLADTALRDAVVTPDGEASVVVRSDWRIELVEIASGRVLASKAWSPHPKKSRPEALAASAGGATVAVADDDRVVVLARTGSTYAVVLSTEAPTQQLFFVPGQQELVAADVERVAVLRPER